MGLILDARGAHVFGSAGSEGSVICVAIHSDDASSARALSQEPDSTISSRELAVRCSFVQDELFKG